MGFPASSSLPAYVLVRSGGPDKRSSSAATACGRNAGNCSVANDDRRPFGAAGLVATKRRRSSERVRRGRRLRRVSFGIFQRAKGTRHGAFFTSSEECESSRIDFVCWTCAVLHSQRKQYPGLHRPLSGAILLHPVDLGLRQRPPRTNFSLLPSR